MGEVHQKTEIKGDGWMDGWMDGFRFYVILTDKT